MLEALVVCRIPQGVSILKELELVERARILILIQILDLKTSYLAMSSKITPPSFSADTQGGMQIPVLSTWPMGSMCSTLEGNGSVRSAAQEATFPTIWALWLTSALKCSSPMFFVFIRTLAWGLWHLITQHFLKVFPSSWDTPQFVFQLSKLSNKLKSYWENKG